MFMTKPHEQFNRESVNWGISPHFWGPICQLKLWFLCFICVIKDDIPSGDYAGRAHRQYE